LGLDNASFVSISSGFRPKVSANIFTLSILARARFIFEPWKTIVIHDIVRYDIETLVHFRGLGVPAGQLGRSINWVDGIAFIHNVMPATEEVIKEQIQ
jgi:hypothetical protein